jgi:hypothetical protein
MQIQKHGFAIVIGWLDSKRVAHLNKLDEVLSSSAARTGSQAQDMHTERVHPPETICRDPKMQDTRPCTVIGSYGIIEGRAGEWDRVG